MHQDVLVARKKVELDRHQDLAHQDRYGGVHSSIEIHSKCSGPTHSICTVRRRTSSQSLSRNEDLCNSQGRPGAGRGRFLRQPEEQLGQFEPRPRSRPEVLHPNAEHDNKNSAQNMLLTTAAATTSFVTHLPGCMYSRLHYAGSSAAFHSGRNALCVPLWDHSLTGSRT